MKCIIGYLLQVCQKITPPSSFPCMSVEEMKQVVHFIRTEFPSEQWTEKTGILGKYMTDIESQMVYFWIENGPDVTMQINCSRDNDNHDREGYKMGKFLQGFYKARGYKVYGMAKNTCGPCEKWAWRLNFGLS